MIYFVIGGEGVRSASSDSSEMVSDILSKPYILGWNIIVCREVATRLKKILLSRYFYHYPNSEHTNQDRTESIASKLENLQVYKLGLGIDLPSFS